MPSQTPAGALLALSAHHNDPDDDNNTMSVDDEEDNDKPSSKSYSPWCWAAWQECTGCSNAPFSLDTMNGSPWSPSTSQTIRVFMLNFLTISDSDQLGYIIRNWKDNDTIGQGHWLNYINSSWRDWKMNDMVDATLAEHGFDPYSVMK
jgi:hypothetical protein